MKKVLVTLFIAALGGLIAVGAYKFLEPASSPQTISEKQAVAFTNLPESGQSGLPNFTQAAGTAVHAVVHIKTSATATVMQPNFNPWDFFGNGGPMFQEKQVPRQASGSGVIIASDGYILTNNHVIANADDIEVVLNDKRSYKGKIVGTDPSTDLALVKIEEKDLAFLRFGNSDQVQIGEWVLAVGNPFNLTSTVTAGIISAKARNINLLGGPTRIESFLQTDAAVNPGNSGGALVNLRGELIGINTAIASNTGNYAGYAFAVPVNIARKVADDLLEFGMVQRGYIGVQIRDVSAALVKEKSLDLNDLKGVYVESLSEKGSAEEAGMKPGDVITSVNGTEVNSVAELQELVGRHRPGDMVSLKVIRNKKELNYNLVLKNEDKTTALVQRQEIFEKLGADFADLETSELKKHKLENGVEVSEIKPGGALGKVGIRKGFIVTSIDKKPVKSRDEIARLLQFKKGSVLMEGVYPNSSARYTYGFSL